MSATSVRPAVDLDALLAESGPQLCQVLDCTDAADWVIYIAHDNDCVHPPRRARLSCDDCLARPLLCARCMQPLTLERKEPLR